MESITNTSMDDEGSKQKQNSNFGVDDSDVSEPARLRCFVLHGIKGNKFLHDYCRYFLPIISVIIWSLLLLN